MRAFIKSTILQGSFLGVVVLIVLFTLNYRAVLGMLTANKQEDFSYQDSYSIVYHGVFQDSPILAIIFWILIVAIVSITIVGVAKFLWLRFK
ncbi:hypothetical protein [Paenibacillus radicis (ex Gao et al. 2016)]|uniref:Uncharacterized protein n=1 Tax=Paenibacillus radicis (ex Gao et al. 2016) TaxID=1737354 RepID=A0A917H7Z5_9BACL|nr:hypothetical protein [Paenibacillus radicis (ex Gao et al. 2016)]GGG70416.1 hypothetical protein GCM10010918_27200 [Paenibacillus radicis (ex Gao et al. 2016)]